LGGNIIKIAGKDIFKVINYVRQQAFTAVFQAVFEDGEVTAAVC
jgi:hypothetical protein